MLNIWEINHFCSSSQQQVGAPVRSFDSQWLFWGLVPRNATQTENFSLLGYYMLGYFSHRATTYGVGRRRNLRGSTRDQTSLFALKNALEFE